jgi:predicted GNAT family acetyltransferase
MHIRQITHIEALSFFLDQEGWKSHVTWRDAGEWYGYFIDNEIVGIVSTQMIGRWTRVKSLVVAKEHRGKGIATSLVCYVSDDKNCTAFAFSSSLKVFEECGFKREKTNKNGVHFMRKTV